MDSIRSNGPGRAIQSCNDRRQGFAAQIFDRTGHFSDHFTGHFAGADGVPIAGNDRHRVIDGAVRLCHVNLGYAQGGYCLMTAMEMVYCRATFGPVGADIVTLAQLVTRLTGATIHGSVS